MRTGPRDAHLRRCSLLCKRITGPSGSFQRTASATKRLEPFNNGMSINEWDATTKFKV